MISPDLHRHDVLRERPRDPNLVFVALLPAVLFILFGAVQGWSDARLPGATLPRT
ncbi:hypothetical protein QJS66_21255 [Kocuria rhizophila]|nr:hypothetical protein QJS66_21255 [Kocuria rhizophila]